MPIGAFDAIDACRAIVSGFLKSRRPRESQGRHELMMMIVVVVDDEDG